MQTQTQVPPALQVLMSMGAQPTAPGPMGQPIPTIASQKVEQQAQGLEALMPGVRQQAMQSAQAAQPVTQAQLQQVMQQQSPGISGLPAQNMRFAEGGVIGYSEGGTPRTYGYAPDYEDARRMGINLSPYDSPEVRREKLERLQKMREFEASPDRGVAIPTEASQANEQALAQAFSPAAQQARMRDMPQRPAQSVSLPKAQPQSTGIAAPRAEAPVRTAAPVAAPATGIATALPAAMTPEEAMGSARAGMGMPGTADLRAAIMEAKQAREQMPASGQAGLAALQQQMDAVKRMEEERKRSMASDRVIAQLLGGRGRPGGLAEADIKFMAGQRAAEDAFYERNVALAAKQDAVNDANAARNVGNKEKYAEAMKNLSDAERAIAQAEATYAAAILTNAGNVRGQDITAQTAAEDRASLERRAAADRAAQAALRNLPGPEQQMIERAIKSLQDANPGMPYHEAYDKVRGAGKGLDQRAAAQQEKNELARRKLLENDMMYATTRMAYVNATDPAKKAEALRKMKEIERLNGIIDEPAAAPAGGAAPAVGTIMQGYRFKGGNPADQNNWEKV